MFSKFELDLLAEELYNQDFSNVDKAIDWQSLSPQVRRIYFELAGEYIMEIIFSKEKKENFLRVEYSYSSVDEAFKIQEDIENIIGENNLVGSGLGEGIRDLEFVFKSKKGLLEAKLKVEELKIKDLRCKVK